MHSIKFHNKKTIYLSILIIFIFLVPFIFFCSNFYANSIVNAVNTSFSDFICEIAEHDARVINSSYQEVNGTLLFIKDYFLNLTQNSTSNNTQELINLRNYLNNPESDSNLTTQLPIKGRYNNYLDLALIDKEGNLTANTYLKYNTVNYEPYLRNYNSKFFVKYKISSTASETLINNVNERNLVAIGLPLENFILDGKEYAAIICLYDLSQTKEMIKINNFGDINRNSIFLENGDFLSPTEIINSINVRYSNFFQQMSKVFLIDMEYETLNEKIKAKESIFIKYQNEKKGSVIYAKIIPIEDSNTYYFLSLTDDILKEQGTNILKDISILIIILCLIIFIFLVITCIAVNNISQLRMESKAKEEFLSTMSHEIRTPLNGIIGLIYLMKSNMDDSEKLNYYFQKTAKTSDYLLQLINNILDISKFDNGKIKLANNPFDIEEMIESIVSINRDVIAKKNITFDVKENIYCSAIFGDEIRIQQIIMNLIGNAIKFTDEGGTISLSVIQENTFETDEISNIFTVSDTGCGISKDFQEHIFEAFSQERNKLKISQKGTGLGLAISQMLCSQMGGTLTVESELGKGSTFTFSLPAKISTQEQVRDFILSSSVEGTDKEHNILIAEDNELSADILDEVLIAANYNHKIVHDGKQVIEAFADSDINEFDVILMDIQMPYYDGYEATQIIRKMKRSDAKTVKIIACSANTFEEDKENAFKAGMNGFIVKPININSLLETLGK